MDLGFNLAQSNRDLKDPTSRQIFGDTSGLLCKNDPILRRIYLHILAGPSLGFKNFLGNFFAHFVIDWLIKVLYKIFKWLHVYGYFFLHILQ